MTANLPHDVESKFEPFRIKMISADISPTEIQQFRFYYGRLLEGQTGCISQREIDPVYDLPDSATFSRFADDGLNALSRTVVIKLNGGLGTSMGMESAKSLLPVKEGLTFLDLICRQILELRGACQCNIPLLFMNSENTRQDTLTHLQRYPELQTGLPLDFLQQRAPKIARSDLSPAQYHEDPDLEWSPCGHGAIYSALMGSGLLDCLIGRGIHTAFISNSDNLGALLDIQILGYFVSHGLPFMMEVADRTAADRKGGHLARAKRDGQLMLREVAQCPQEEQEAFQDITLYKYFNTNTIWINLHAVKDLLEANDGFVKLPLIRNAKTVNPKDPSSQPVYQIETAMGAAISLLPGAAAIRVPRTRFLPVKTTQDLIELWSDRYDLTDGATVNAEPDLLPVSISLDPAFYRLIDDVRFRFPHGAPSLKQCTQWIVQGDVRFGRDVILIGKVILRNRSDIPVPIPDGTVLENCETTVTGSGEVLVMPLSAAG